MSRKSAYEDSLSGKMEEFPLPDEDASWDKMKRLLDEDDDRGFWFFKDYRVLGLLTLLLIGWGIWLMNSQLDGKATGKARETPRTSDTTRIAGDKISVPSNYTTDITDKQTVDPKEIIVSAIPGRSGSINNSNQKSNRVTVKNKRRSNVKKKSLFKPSSPAIKNNDPQKENSIINEPRQAKTIDAGTAAISSAQTVLQTDNTNLMDSNVVRQEILSDSTTAKTHVRPDSMITRQEDSSSDKKQVIKLSKPSSRKYLLSAGLGIQQQIQTGGQQPIKYGYKATSLVSDYIPSVWINFGEKDKWFLQTGFVYSSPQLVKEFAFNRQTKSDTFSTVTNTLILKKTFYSQLPLSFNYYVKPNWSVGAGMTFTWLRGAIAEKETRIKNTSSQLPVVSRQIMPINSFTDSFLYRSHSFFTLQSDYEWKRFSFGLKYTKDLQSYIKYTMPDGTVVEDRNWGLQAVLRVRLWEKQFKY